MKFWLFGEGGKPEHLRKNLTEQRQKPTELNSHNDKCTVAIIIAMSPQSNTSPGFNTTPTLALAENVYN